MLLWEKNLQDQTQTAEVICKVHLVCGRSSLTEIYILKSERNIWPSESVFDGYVGVIMMISRLSDNIRFIMGRVLFFNLTYFTYY
jgi:hypothetical protein